MHTTDLKPDCSASDDSQASIICPEEKISDDLFRFFSAPEHFFIHCKIFFWLFRGVDRNSNLRSAEKGFGIGHYGALVVVVVAVVVAFVVVAVILVVNNGFKIELTIGRSLCFAFSWYLRLFYGSDRSKNTYCVVNSL